MGKIKPKKSLGQNFLKDKEALKKIVDAAELSLKDKVLEIGPGTGLLTKELLKKTKNLILIEKDSALASQLKIKSEKLKVVDGDVLDINLPRLIEKNNFQGYKVVANIPYYITGKILRLLLGTEYPPSLLVLLVQKEVAERICAKPGEMSILSVSVQYFGKPEIVGDVPGESFDPVPKVDSAILKITPKPGFPSLRIRSQKLMKLVKIGFSSRRKTLANNLCAGLGIEKQAVEEFLASLGREKNTRAQQLTVAEWENLVDTVGGK